MEKFETVPSCENKLEKTRVFKAWQKLTVGADEMPETDFENLDSEQYKELLYGAAESELDKTAEILGIENNPNLIEKLNQAKNAEEKTTAQREIVKSLFEKLRTIANSKWAFYPKEMQKQKKINCSGSALLCGHILNKLGIETEYANPANHAMNFVKLADGTLDYVDAHTNKLIEDVKTEETEICGVKTRKIQEKGIAFETIPIFPQRDSIAAMLGNFESLKAEAERGDEEAAIIYQDNRTLLDTTNFQIFSEKLYPEYGEFLKSEEWQAEEKRVAEIREKFRQKIIPKS